MAKENSRNLEDKLIVEGINSEGYGIMPKLIMQDTRLTIEAKAIYAYLVSYAGSGSTAFPGLKKILKDLCISENRFYKHRKLLLQLGYISVQAIRNEKAVIYKNIYTLHSNPEQKEEVPSKMKDTGVSHKTTVQGIPQNDGDKLLVSLKKINIDDDDDEYIKEPVKTDIEKMGELIQDNEPAKALAQSLFFEEVSVKDIVAILIFIKLNNLEIDPDCIKQQLDWMSEQSKSKIGISNFATYFCNGYSTRLNNKSINASPSFSDDLKAVLGIEEEVLPEIPMYNWLEK